MTDQYYTACQHDIGTAVTAPAMPAFSDFDITVPRLPRVSRDTAPAVTGRTNGLRARAPLAARVAAALRPQLTPWVCSCMIPAPCDGRCLVCGGSL